MAALATPVQWKLTADGEWFRNQGTPEAQVWRALSPAPEQVSMVTLAMRLARLPEPLQHLDLLGIGLAQGIKRNWIAVTKPPDWKVSRINNELITDTVQQQLETIHSTPNSTLLTAEVLAALPYLKARKLVQPID